MRKIANRFGRCFEREKETFNLESLKAGDHVVEESLFGFATTFWHHMIVESVDLSRQQINVIHYFHDLDPPWKWPSVCRTSLTFTADRFYRVVYEDNECFPSNEVLKKAEARLAEKRYCPFTNNCEHFANECKTGEKRCFQIWTSIEILGKSAISSITLFLSRAKNWCRMMMRAEISWLRQPGVTQTAEYVTKFSTGLCIFIAFIIEIVLLGYDCSDAKKKFEEGKLTGEEYCEVIVKRVCGAVCSIPGFAIGFVLGGMIVPVLGAFLGGILGDYIGKEAGGYFGDILTPLFIKHFGEIEKSA